MPEGVERACRILERASRHAPQTVWTIPLGPVSHTISVLPRVLWRDATKNPDERAARRSVRGARPEMGRATELEDLPDGVLTQIALGLSGQERCAPTCPCWLARATLLYALKSPAGQLSYMSSVAICGGLCICSTSVGACRSPSEPACMVDLGGDSSFMLVMRMRASYYVLRRAGCRRKVLPMLSKRWAALLRGGGLVWAAMHITDADFPEGGEPDPVAMAAWFACRAGSAKKTVLSNRTPRLPASLLAAMLTSQAPSLTALNLDFQAVAVELSSADVAVLATSTRLEGLSITASGAVEGERWDDNAAAVIRALSWLPALKDLDVHGEWQSCHMPTAVELAALRGPHLTRLFCDMASYDDESLHLGALPTLRCCVLWWHVPEGALHVTPISFSGATGLTRLQFRGQEKVQLAPHCLRSLSSLAELSLHGCGLTSVPAALSGVGRTLRRLELSENCGMLLSEHCLSALCELQELKLPSCGLTAVTEAAL